MVGERTTGLQSGSHKVSDKLAHVVLRHYPVSFLHNSTFKKY